MHGGGVVFFGNLVNIGKLLGTQFGERVRRYSFLLILGFRQLPGAPRVGTVISLKSAGSGDCTSPEGLRFAKKIQRRESQLLRKSRIHVGNMLYGHERT